MALARVVEFENVNGESIERARAQIEGEPPDGLRATEIVVLHDAAAAKSLVAVFFDNEEDYAEGDAILGAMSPGDTPGTRLSVTKYAVAVRKAL